MRREPAVQDMPPAGWGDPARRTGLPPHALTWLSAELGDLRGPSLPSAVPALPPPSLSDAVLAALIAAVGDEHVLVDDAARLLRAAGKSYQDLVRTRAGTVDAPDAVVLPGTASEVAAVLGACASYDVAVVPFGGGTSVVGGVTATGPRVALDLRRMDRVLAVDDEALTAVLQPGLRGPAAEALLNARGLTLGHFPQSYEHATIGGYAATRSAGQASTGYGRFEDLVLGVVLQTPAGELRLGRGARSAAGPSLLQLVVGSEGAFGVITEVTLRVKRLPSATRYEGFFFRTWEDGCAALRTLAQEGLAPDVARLSDPDETRVQLALAGTSRVKAAALGLRGYGSGCLAVLGWLGTAESVGRRRKGAASVVRRHRGTSVGTGVGERWEHGRYDGPYLRDDLMDAGVLVETLETSATWSQLQPTWSAVRSALAARLPGAVVMCHVSHLYAHGASLYFTVLGVAEVDPVAQWQRAKDAACDALVSSGATITHHHAVGRDHRAWMRDEVGPLGVDVLRAVKGVLDPAGVMNPGVLLPAED